MATTYNSLIAKDLRRHGSIVRGIQYRVRNADKIGRALKNMPIKVFGQNLEKLVRDAGRPIVDAAKASLAGSTEDRTGALRNSLGIIVRSNRKKQRVYAAIGPRSGPQFRMVDTRTGRVVAPTHYAHLIEFGSQPHVIVRRGVTTRARRSRGPDSVPIPAGTDWVQVIEHPGTPARPFLRPAFDTAGSAARDQLARALGVAIEKVAQEGSLYRA